MISTAVFYPASALLSLTFSDGSSVDIFDSQKETRHTSRFASCSADLDALRGACLNEIEEGVVSHHAEGESCETRQEVLVHTTAGTVTVCFYAEKEEHVPVIAVERHWHDPLSEAEMAALEAFAPLSQWHIQRKGETEWSAEKEGDTFLFVKRAGDGYQITSKALDIRLKAASPEAFQNVINATWHLFDEESR